MPFAALASNVKCLRIVQAGFFKHPEYTMHTHIRETLGKLRRSKKWILATVLVSILTDIVLYGFLLPVLPFTLESPGKENTFTAVWNSALIACHGLATFLTALPVAMVADYVRQRGPLFRFGLVFSVVGTILLCVGKPVSVLLVGRILQGTGSTFVWTTGLAVLADAFDLKELGVALALVEIATCLGSVSGPIVGGALFAFQGYKASFAAAFGLLSVDIVLRCLVITRDRSLVTPELSDTPAESVSSSNASSPITPSSPTKLLHTRAERSTAPLAARRMNLQTTWRLIRDRYSQMLVLVCVVTSLLQTSLDALLPLFVKRTFHWTASGAGLIFLTFTAASVTNLAVGRYIDKRGTKWLPSLGLFACGPPLVLLRLIEQDTMANKACLCVLLITIGLCFALIAPATYKNFAHCVSRVQETPGTPDRDFAQAYSLVTMAYSGGCFLVFLVTLTEQSLGWSITMPILGGISMLTTVPVAIWMDSKTSLDDESIAEAPSA